MRKEVKKNGKKGDLAKAHQKKGALTVRRPTMGCEVSS